MIHTITNSNITWKIKIVLTNVFVSCTWNTNVESDICWHILGPYPYDGNIDYCHMINVNDNKTQVIMPYFNLTDLILNKESRFDNYDYVCLHQFITELNTQNHKYNNKSSPELDLNYVRFILKLPIQNKSYLYKKLEYAEKNPHYY